MAQQVVEQGLPTLPTEPVHARTPNKKPRKPVQRPPSRARPSELPLQDGAPIERAEISYHACTFNFGGLDPAAAIGVLRGKSDAPPPRKRVRAPRTRSPPRDNPSTDEVLVADIDQLLASGISHSRATTASTSSTTQRADDSEPRPATTSTAKAETADDDSEGEPREGRDVPPSTGDYDLFCSVCKQSWPEEMQPTCTCPPLDEPVGASVTTPAPADQPPGTPGK